MGFWPDVEGLGFNELADVSPVRIEGTPWQAFEPALRSLEVIT